MTLCPAYGIRIQLTPSGAVNQIGAALNLMVVERHGCANGKQASEVERWPVTYPDQSAEFCAARSPSHLPRAAGSRHSSI